MRLPTNAGIVVEGCHTQDDLRLSNPLGDEVSTASGAEVTKLSRRRLERAKRLPGNPAKVLAIDARGAGKGRRMRLAARVAVAVTDWAGETIDFDGRWATGKGSC